MEIEELDAYLKKNLLARHYQRSKYVVKLLLTVAKTYALNEQHARLAGMLHLVSRQMKPEQMAEYVRAHEKKLVHRLPKEYQRVYHLTGPASAWFALETLDERSDDVFRAVRDHTFLYKNPSLLAQCLYAASILAAANQNDPRTAVLLRDFMAGKLDHVLRALSKRDIRSLEKTAARRLARITNPDMGDIS
jgi:HD superfamily phosphohydrolase YqeK